MEKWAWCPNPNCNRPIHVDELEAGVRGMVIHAAEGFRCPNCEVVVLWLDTPHA